ncbi:MAG: hypothetical protein DHS80DRAFT_21041 [Piptocephalis tieghemiana]|nr:MAG: hypothetical protein DHS80DRAFT_21041 [Piptocephalis tieghemiana]
MHLIPFLLTTFFLPLVLASDRVRHQYELSNVPNLAILHAALSSDYDYSVVTSGKITAHVMAGLRNLKSDRAHMSTFDVEVPSNHDMFRISKLRKLFHKCFIKTSSRWCSQLLETSLHLQDRWPWNGESQEKCLFTQEYRDILRKIREILWCLHHPWCLGSVKKRYQILEEIDDLYETWNQLPKYSKEFQEYSSPSPPYPKSFKKLREFLVRYGCINPEPRDSPTYSLPTYQSLVNPELPLTHAHSRDHSPSSSSSSRPLRQETPPLRSQRFTHDPEMYESSATISSVLGIRPR